MESEPNDEYTYSCLAPWCSATLVIDQQMRKKTKAFELGKLAQFCNHEVLKQHGWAQKHTHSIRWYCPDHAAHA